MTASVRALDVIAHKRDGGAHDRATLEAFLGAYVRGEVPDYQVAAWLMAVVWRGMTPQETADLTAVMAASGDVLDLADLPHTVDKHSTGGVGDKTTLVLAPLLAELGGTVAKMSGRGLGHTGGTVDKLEAIPGFRSTLDERAFLEQVRAVGVAVTGQSKDLAPADGLLYALRDATGTVASLPLIASSIMSKKLAGGARSLVLDVKVGSGAFMKTEADARALAVAMVDIGRRAGRNVRAVLSSMAEPLGRAVGNALEVREAIAVLRGGGPADLRTLVVALAAEVLEATGLPHDAASVGAALDDGRAYARFERWVAAQGGDVGALDRLEVAPGEAAWRAPAGGVVAAYDAEAIGRAVQRLGGGRARKSDVLDLGVGLTLHAKVGDAVRAGEALATLHHRDGRGLDAALAALDGAVDVRDAAEAPPLVLGVLGR
jgi:pyrimidine-nucleoside phosphorylase/thymidine phosphorylase